MSRAAAATEHRTIRRRGTILRHNVGWSLAHFFTIAAGVALLVPFAWAVLSSL
jgi:hypothetical protein